MINRVFNSWTVLGEIKTDKPGKHYECLCECGNVRIKAGTELRAGRGKQCQECQYNSMYDTDREIGKKYGKWTVLKFINVYKKLQRFECSCECGYIGIHAVAELRSGKSTQCSTCHNRENANNNIKHGMHKTKIYKVWSSMLDRCRNSKNAAYKYYGARGISFDPLWVKFENFYNDMCPRPDSMTLDRINNDGPYSKENCRWITHLENCQNRKKRK
jgi:hypothetical protein